MSASSPRLSLPYLSPAQAQKHVTHNEAITLLDVLAQLHLLEFDAQTPPASPSEGDAYAIGAAPNGAWGAHAGQLAVYTNGAWVYLSPAQGWYATDAAAAELRIFNGAQWQPATGTLQNVNGIGIGTNWDNTNRLSVTADATLLSHAGDDHRLKINKDSAADTASLLFQSGFSGRAEMGTSGSDNFSIKVSDDGATWRSALTADAPTGNITAPRLASGIITVPTGTAASITTPGTGGFVMIYLSDSEYPQNDHSGFLAYDTGPSLNLTTMTIGSRLHNLGTQALTGTTGIAGETSVSVSSGKLFIENSTGIPRKYSYLFLCGE